MDDEEFEIEEDDQSIDDSNKSTMDKFMDIFNENKKLFIIVGVVILLLIIFSAISKTGSSNKIELSEKEKTITTEAGVKLQLLVNGTETNKGVEWTSSDERVATVDNTGGVKGVSPGKATITAKYENEKYTCEVTVTEGDEGIAIEKVKFANDGTLVMSVGSTYTPTIEIEPSGAKVKNKYFSVSNTEVANVDINTGLVTAQKVGNAMLRVTVNNAAKMSSIKLIVISSEITPGIYILPTSISLSEKDITLTEGERKTISYTQEPENSSKDYINWVSADPSIAVVENNELIARKPGDVEITVTSFGVKDTMKVHVKAATVEVISLDITSSTSLTMNVGDTSKISASISPSNASNKELVYESDNNTIATVDSVGNITATGAGTTTIKVASASKPNIYSVVNVTVNGGTTPVDPTPTPVDSGGGSSGGPTVGTVKLTSNNDAVEKSVSDVSGKTMTSTTLTVTTSGNVDKVMYCKYEYNVESSCSTYTVYNGPFEFKTPGTFVFKVVPYYQNNVGTEITRYVKISGSGTGTNKCQPGRYLSGTSCLACKPGNYCSGDRMIACPAGKGSAAYSSMPSDCTICAANYYSTGDGNGCKACPTGTTSPAGSTSSTQCTSGGSATSITCVKGTYYNGNGACATCEANYWCPGITASKSSRVVQGRNACASGKTSPAGSYDSSQCTSGGGSNSITCAKGAYYNGSGGCATCPVNHWCPGVTTTKSSKSIEGKNACPSGYTSPGGSYAQSQCTAGGGTSSIPRVQSYSVPSKTTKFTSIIANYPFVALNSIKADKNFNLIGFCYYLVTTGGATDSSKCTGTSAQVNKMSTGTKGGRTWFKMPAVENKWYVQELSSSNNANYYFEAQELNNWGQGYSTKDFILVWTIGIKDSSGRHMSNQFKVLRIKADKTSPWEWPIQKVK